MTTDPFELSQYTTSFDRIDAFSPNALIFADFQVEFSRISEQILARQVSIGVGFNVPDIEFAPISNFEATTPAGVVEAIRLFQEAIGEFVTGGIIDRYGRLSNCDVYIGFFHFSNGFPIVGLGQILPDSGQTDWTEPPDINDISSVVTFTQEVGNNLNEIVFALNVLKYIHGRMVLAYDLDDSCGNPPTPTPPTPTPTPTPAPTPTPTPPTPAPTPPTPAPTPPTPAPTPPTPAPTPPSPSPPAPIASNMVGMDGVGILMVGGTKHMSNYNGPPASWGIKEQAEGNNIEDM